MIDDKIVDKLIERTQQGELEWKSKSHFLNTTPFYQMTVSNSDKCAKFNVYNDSCVLNSEQLEVNRVKVFELNTAIKQHLVDKNTKEKRNILLWL